MPTWINIESVMIVQPNGTILSQYRQLSSHNPNKGKRTSIISSQSETQSPQIPSKQKKNSPANYNTQKRIVKEKLKNISKQVIEASRKLYRENYESFLNRLIVERNLVYYRAKHNVLVIVVVKKFSVDVNQIQQLISKVFNWYGDKCMSMGVDMNVPNLTHGRYQLGQFKKLQWEIAHEIDQKVSTSEIDKLPILPSLGQEEFVKEKFDINASIINEREQKLKNIADKVTFIDDFTESSRSSQMNRNNNIFIRMVQKVIPQAFRAKEKKNRKFRRQSSFMQNTLMALRFMRFKVILLYFCLIIALTLGTMVYLGWFQDEEL